MVTREQVKRLVKVPSSQLLREMARTRLPVMKRSSVAAIIFVALFTVTTVSAQNQPSLDGAQIPASLTKLFNPIYPRLAQQARISGTVRINLQLRKGGTVESAKVIDGHPMLRQAALESAQKSEFECADCSGATSYFLVYEFELRDGCHFGPHCELLDSDQSLVTQTPGRVVVSAVSLCTCDPAVAVTRVRSPRCLYLWKCGRQEAPND
jgi:TonB family protein